MVGRLIGTVGLRGEFRVRAGGLGTDAIAVGTAYRLGSETDARSVRVTRVRRHRDRFFVTLAGIETIEAAEPLVGCDLLADRAAVSLGPNEYLDADLIGARILDQDERERGTVVRVEHYPAQDCLVVAPGEALVPLVRAFVREIDVAGGVIRMDLPRGLLDPAEAEEA